CLCDGVLFGLCYGLEVIFGDIVWDEVSLCFRCFLGLFICDSRWIWRGRLLSWLDMCVPSFVCWEVVADGLSHLC
ncbi:MAG: hypothetical protein ACYSTJ_05460, partial [Planctomycetota bacterium]